MNEIEICRSQCENLLVYPIKVWREFLFLFLAKWFRLAERTRRTRSQRKSRGRRRRGECTSKSTIPRNFQTGISYTTAAADIGRTRTAAEQHVRCDFVIILSRAQWPSNTSMENTHGGYSVREGAEKRRGRGEQITVRLLSTQSRALTLPGLYKRSFRHLGKRGERTRGDLFPTRRYARSQYSRRNKSDSFTLRTYIYIYMWVGVCGCAELQIISIPAS